MRFTSGLFTVLAFMVFEATLAATTVVPIVLPKDPQELEIYHQLQNLTVADTRWTDVDIEVALKELTLKSKTVDPKHKGVNFILRLDPNKPAKTLIGYQFHRKIEQIILLDETPIGDVAGYICNQTNLSYNITRDGVVFSQ